LDDRKVGEAWRVRQQPPKVHCWTSTGRTPRSASLLVKPNGQAGGKAQGHVLVVAEAAGQPPTVFGDLAATVLAVFDARGHSAAIPGADLGELAGYSGQSWPSFG